jgi:hypothetical protein
MPFIDRTDEAPKYSYKYPNLIQCVWKSAVHLGDGTYWIYLLQSTQQTFGCNGFYNDMFRLTRVIVRLCS